MGFQKSEADPNLYFIMVGDDPLILLLYLDDLFITGGERPIAVCKKDLASEYEMTDIGLMHCFWDWRFGRSLVIFSWDRESMQLIF